jgi:shikimate dehydrogenase
MDQYRVYGNPIKQSKSPFIHQSFSKSTHQNLIYQSEFVELEAFKETVIKFVQQGGKGANVTAPFKEQALQLCDHLTQRAKLAGAVNTLSFDNGLIKGDNTDGLGLVQDLLRNNLVLKASNILLLGAGGAVKGVILPLLEQNPNSVTIANRTVSKAEDLCLHFNSQQLSAKSFEQASSAQYDLIINATSASLQGDIPALSPCVIDRNTICYDMVYGKTKTPFLQWAEKHQAKETIDGLGMLIGQAAESFYIWRSVKPDIETVLQQLRVKLSE